MHINFFECCPINIIRKTRLRYFFKLLNRISTYVNSLHNASKRHIFKPQRLRVLNHSPTHIELTHWLHSDTGHGCYYTGCLPSGRKSWMGTCGLDAGERAHREQFGSEVQGGSSCTSGQVVMVSVLSFFNLFHFCLNELKAYFSPSKERSLLVLDGWGGEGGRNQNRP